MPVRTANAEWKGTLKEGSGVVKTETGVLESAYSFASRFETGVGTNPEELVGAAHAACYSMFLASLLGKAGHPADSVKTIAKVYLATGDGGPTINRIELVTEARAPGISPEDFDVQAKAAKFACPVSKALASVDIQLEARLL
jgi:osmotically inducible protein OsmC